MRFEGQCLSQARVPLLVDGNLETVSLGICVNDEGIVRVSPKDVLDSLREATLQTPTSCGIVF